MKITIEGDKEQVREGCLEIAAGLRMRRGRTMSAPRRAEYDRTVAQRQTIRAAFDLIRDDPEEKVLVDSFAKALGGVRGTITTSLLDTAKTIIAERQRP